MEQRRKEKAEQAEERRKNIEAKKLKQMSNPTPSVSSQVPSQKQRWKLSCKRGTVSMQKHFLVSCL